MGSFQGNSHGLCLMATLLPSQSLGRCILVGAGSCCVVPGSRAELWIYHGAVADGVVQCLVLSQSCQLQSGPPLEVSFY